VVFKWEQQCLPHHDKEHIRHFPGGPVVKTALPVQGIQIQSLVRRVGSHMSLDQKTPRNKSKTKALQILKKYIYMKKY